MFFLKWISTFYPSCSKNEADYLRTEESNIYNLQPPLVTIFLIHSGPVKIPDNGLINVHGVLNTPPKSLTRANLCALNKQRVHRSQRDRAKDISQQKDSSREESRFNGVRRLIQRVAPISPSFFPRWVILSSGQRTGRFFIILKTISTMEQRERTGFLPIRSRQFSREFYLGDEKLPRIRTEKEVGTTKDF